MNNTSTIRIGFSAIGMVIGLILLVVGGILFGSSPRDSSRPLYALISLIGFIIFIFSSYNLYKLYKKDNDNN